MASNLKVFVKIFSTGVIQELALSKKANWIPTLESLEYNWQGRITDQINPILDSTKDSAVDAELNAVGLEAKKLAQAIVDLLRGKKGFLKENKTVFDAYTTILKQVVEKAMRMQDIATRR